MSSQSSQIALGFPLITPHLQTTRNVIINLWIVSYKLGNSSQSGYCVRRRYLVLNLNKNSLICLLTAHKHKLTLSLTASMPSLRPRQLVKGMVEKIKKKCIICEKSRQFRQNPHSPKKIFPKKNTTSQNHMRLICLKNIQN